MDNSKTCPFCGGGLLSVDSSAICCPVEYNANVRCSDCDTLGPGSYRHDTEAEAVATACELWDTRPTPTVQDAAKVLLEEWKLHGEGLLGELSCYSPGGEIEFFQMEPDIDGDWVKFSAVTAALRAIAEGGE